MTIPQILSLDLDLVVILSFLLDVELKIYEKQQKIAYFIFFRVSFCHFSCYISELSLMDMVA